MAVERTVVFLLAENCLLREALVRVLRNKEDICVAGAVAFSSSVLEKIALTNPQVVLFDSASIALSGPRLVAHMRERTEGCKSIMVGMEEDEPTFLRAVAEGVVGYVLKNASAAEIVRVIRAVAGGEAVCPPQFSVSLFRRAAREISLSFKSTKDTKFGLSRREQQLVELIRIGLSNKEIGARLHLSEQTVKNHIHRILRKVGACDRLEIVQNCREDATGSMKFLDLAG